MTLTPPRLRRLVTHRERLERLQELELAEAQRLRLVRQQALEESHASRTRLLDAGVPAHGPVEPADLASNTDYLLRVQREIRARAAAVAHSDDEVAEEREVLLSRRRDRKAMEALLDSRVEEERIARNRADIKRIDELAVNRWRPTNGH
jgi:flagellar export protein FliJ